MESVVYEVTACVDAAIAEAFERFMIEHHIGDVLATGCFATATLEQSAPGEYRIRYITSREELARYFEQFAPRLRRDVLDRFPEGLELSRQEWNVLNHFA